VRDLQRRLDAAGFPPGPTARAGVFCADTEQAVRAFQLERGLTADGVVDQHTWDALVEATWHLGSRLLFLTAPNLRGDDVAELQSRLGRIGFDCGKVDGILGPQTARALLSFQRECGLVPDGTCGPVTLANLDRLSRQTGTGPGVATVRERDELRARGATSLRNLRVVVGQFGGLAPLTRSITRDLRAGGATVMPVDEPDARAQALAANAFHADAYIGLDSGGTDPLRIAYYAVPTFHSPGGRSLAERLAIGLHEVTATAPCVTGIRLQVLRETKMPAVLVTFADPRQANDLNDVVRKAVREAVEQWAEQPI
jgi:N-acetylmuramoyl-L-alanine amidase